MRKRELSGQTAFPFGVLPYFICYYMCSATYSTYYANYLVERGIDKGEIGSIMALSPIIALLVQPVWGMAGDRVKWKNTLLAVLTGGTSLVLFAGGFVNSTLYAYAVVCSYAFFSTSITPLMETITLEALQKGRYAYGPVRLIGSVAYAVTAPVIGLVMADHYAMAPFFAAMFMGLGLMAVLFMPKVAGHGHGKKNRANVLQLFKHKQLMLLMGFTIVLMLSMSYYNTYFSLYFQEMGASSTVLGIAFFVQAMGEVPFLLVGDKVLRKIGAGRVLLLCAAAITVRMLCIGVSTNIPFVLVTQLLHGLSIVTMNFTMAKFVNVIVPEELKSSGQMLVSVVGFGIARAVGAWISGMMVNAVGMRVPFFVSSAVALMGLIVFGCIILRSPELKNAGREA